MIAARRALVMLITAAAAVLAIGCGAKYPEAIRDIGAIEATRMASLEHRYVISAGDELEIVFFHTPELNMTLPVRPDGYISLPFAHDVRAAGRTTEELRGDLLSAYSHELESPEIAVIVRTFVAQKIHVGGEVDTPGVYPLEGPMTVLDAVLAAGVITRTAKLDEVLVIRRDEVNQAYQVLAVDVSDALNSKDPTQNIALAPYDAVFVPTSHIADVNNFINLYIRQNIPIDFGIRFEAIRFP